MARRGIILISIAVLLLNTGCASIIVGAAIYKSGEIKRLYPATPEETFSACIETLNNLRIKIKEKLLGGITSKIYAEWPNGIPLKIKLVLKAKRITEVTIRSGYVGGVLDRGEMKMIHNRIAGQLTI